MGFGPFSGGDSATQTTTNQQVGAQGATTGQGASGTYSPVVGLSGNNTQANLGQNSESGTFTASGSATNADNTEVGAGGFGLGAHASIVGSNISITTPDVEAIHAIANTSAMAIGNETSFGLGALEANQNITTDAIGANTELANYALGALHDTANLAIEGAHVDNLANAQLATESINASQQETMQALGGNEALQSQLSSFESSILAAGAPQTQAYAQESLNAGTTPGGDFVSSSGLTKDNKIEIAIALAGLLITFYYYFEYKRA